MMRTHLATCVAFVAFAAADGIAADETNPKVTLTFLGRRSLGEVGWPFTAVLRVIWLAVTRKYDSPC